MTKFKVRDGFWLHGLASEPVVPGTIVDLNAEQANAYAHQIEAVDPLDHDGDGRKGGSLRRKGKAGDR